MSVFNLSRHQRAAIVDVAAQMRVGHPQIEAGDCYLLDLFERMRAAKRQPLRILVVGAGTGFFVARLKQRMLDVRLWVHEDYPAASALLHERLADFDDIEIQTESLMVAPHSVDVVLSWGSHHHLPHSLLQDIRQALASDGVFVLGDEFCPEYCGGDLAVRVRDAQTIAVCDGYLLTSWDEVQAYGTDGALPAAAIEMERCRQHALWAWYRFVIDYAMERGCLAVVDDELRATRHDLRTEEGDEHKMSPLIVERELGLAGFEMQSRHSVAAQTGDSLHSFFIYEYVIR